MRDNQLRWVNVKSSRIKSLRYDPSTLVLDVKFRNGRVYQYSNVTISMFDTVISAESIGSAFGLVIENNSTVKYEEITRKDI